ncbi:MAG: C39 family peptidase [Bryobacterales bacterium]|nr:C39 family peptidase [Bryobacterales bacterium]MBV9398671.1 C39 family peptidase [Bryobacterales bacterium]
MQKVKSGLVGGGDPGGPNGSGDPGGPNGSGDPGGPNGSGDPGGPNGSGAPGPAVHYGVDYPAAAASAPKQINVIGPVVIEQRLLRFRIQRQEQADWCWAACAASIEKYFDHDSKIKQCDVASKTLRVEYPQDELPDSDPGCCCHCCCEPDPCDKPARLGIALQQIHKWRNSLQRSLTFEEVQREIDRGRPIGAGIKWNSGGADGSPGTTGHFVVIRGYRLLSSGACQLYIADPLNASRLVDFGEFTFAYYGEGQWVETDLVHSGLE